MKRLWLLLCGSVGVRWLAVEPADGPVQPSQAEVSQCRPPARTTKWRRSGMSRYTHAQHVHSKQMQQNFCLLLVKFIHILEQDISNIIIDCNQRNVPWLCQINSLFDLLHVFGKPSGAWLCGRRTSASRVIVVWRELVIWVSSRLSLLLILLLRDRLSC